MVVSPLEALLSSYLKRGPSSFMSDVICFLKLSKLNLCGEQNYRIAFSEKEPSADSCLCTF